MTNSVSAVETGPSSLNLDANPGPLAIKESKPISNNIGLFRMAFIVHWLPFVRLITRHRVKSAMARHRFMPSRDYLYLIFSNKRNLVSTTASFGGRFPPFVVQALAWIQLKYSATFFARFGATETKRTCDGWGPGMDRVDMVLDPASTSFAPTGS